jgi:hypothetical protein
MSGRPIGWRTRSRERPNTEFSHKRKRRSGWKQSVVQGQGSPIFSDKLKERKRKKRK